jgi:hypothetical protein
MSDYKETTPGPTARAARIDGSALVMTRKLLAIALVSSVLSAGCFEFLTKSPTNPSQTVNFLGGQWTSTTANAGSLLASCTNFRWTVTEQSASSGSGTFTATCFTTLQVSGTAQGTLSGATLNWSASALATGSGIAGDCAITLAGSATMANNEITIPYSGTTCLGPVSGTEVLKKL